MRDPIESLQGMGVVNQRPFLLGLLADVYRRTETPTKALLLLDGALTIVDSTQERWFEAELHRLRAEALLTSSFRCPDQAKVSLHRALAPAREQGAKFWELRAATSLARLRRDRGKRTEARDLLAPIYGLVHRRIDTPALQDAKSLLDQLT